jgi:AcrR family transcriptional regulator
MKPVASTRKGQLSSARILEAALALFAERGFAGTTMQDIAAKADVAVSLAYKFYAGKDALVLAYYDQLSTELEVFASHLPGDSVSARYTAVIRHKLQRLTPYRRALGSIATMALDPESEIGVMNEHSAGLRARNAAVYQAVVAGSRDVNAASAISLARILYVLDLLLVFAWMQDRSTGQSATNRLIGMLEEALRFLPMALWLPPVRAILERLEPLLTDLLRLPDPRTEEHP